MNVNWFKRALIASMFSNVKQAQLGAVIVNKRPVSTGWNQNKTHPTYSDGEIFYTIHAEMHALLRAKRSVQGCDIYVFRKDAKGNYANARTCGNCLGILIEAGIKNIYYTRYEEFEGDSWYEEIRL